MLLAVVRNVVILAGIMTLGAVALRDATTLMEAPSGATGPADPGAPAARAQAIRAQAARTEAAREPEPNTLVLKAGRGGHYLAEGTINGRGVTFLVDTGASVVTVSRSEARRIGYTAGQLEFTGRAQTANGLVRVASVVLDEIAIGDIVLRKVPAAVVDAEMDVALLGMSFLRRLAGYEVRANELILRW